MSDERWKDKIITMADKVGKFLVSKVINNATFSQTVTGAEIDITDYNNFIVTYKTGTKTSSPTLDIKLQIKDANDNWIDDADYVATQITTATSGVAFKGYLEAVSTVRIVCTYGGTGNFAETSVIFQAKK